MHPEHAGQLPNTEHVVLPDGQWADLKLSLTHGEAQRVETAQLLADWDVQGELRLASAMVESALSGAPEKWRKEHYDNSVRVVKFALESYEKANAAALASADIRQRMADAHMALLDTFARVFTAAWSYSMPLSEESWEAIDMAAARIVRVRAQRIWNELQKELGERLKDEGT